MAQFDRFDICAAHLALENDWNKDGWVRERPSNARRMESTGCQLARIQYSPGMAGGSFSALETENEKEIYVNAIVRFGLAPLVDPDDDLGEWIAEYYVPEFITKHFPQVTK